MNTFGGRRVSVEFIGDAASLEKSFADVSTATKEYTDLSVASSTKVADARIAATTKSIKALREDIVTFSAASTSYVKGSDEQIAATIRLAAAQKRLAAVTGETIVATARTGTTAKTAERDLNKTARGLLAGSGAASSLGRSLAFASTGFIAFATGATLIRDSIKASLDLAATQRQVQAQLKTSGKTWQQYGSQVDATDLKLSHISGFTNQELLQSFGYLVRVTGNVSTALKLNATAADVARGRHITLSAASIALAKALGGSATALKRLGITIPPTLKGMDALNYVTAKFAGQARAGATVSDRFHAALVNFEEVIGTALLPTFTHLTTSLTDWLSKMTESGRLQKDVTETVHALGTAFHVLGDIIGTVDKVTGSFKNTLELLLAAFAIKKVFVFGDALVGLAAKWGLVTTAATEAAAAETAATVGGGAAGAAGVAEVAGGAAAGGLALSAPIIGGAAAAAFIAYKGLTAGTGKSQVTTGISGSQTRVIVEGVGPMLKQKGQWYRVGRGVLALASADEAALAQGVASGSSFAPNVGPPLAPGLSRFGGPSRGAGRIGGGGPPTVFKSFTDTIGNQLAQARAALTKSTKDDVAAAKREIAFIKREIAGGHLKGASLIQALQAEASAVSTIQSAEVAAAQKRAAAIAKAAAKAAAAAARIQARLTAAIDPIRLEVGLSKAQSEDNAKEQLVFLKKLRIAARAALAAIKKQYGNSIKGLELQKQAYDQITQLNQSIAADTKTAVSQYKQLNLDKLTGGLNLTPAQRKALRARLSQVGPGHTVPGSGTGAYGQTIGADGRPIHVHTHISIDGKPVADSVTRHQHRRRRRNSSQRRGPNAGSSG